MMSENAKWHPFHINFPHDFQHGPLPVPTLYTSPIVCKQATLESITAGEMTHWLLLSFRNESQCNVTVKNGSILWNRLWKASETLQR